MSVWCPQMRAWTEAIREKRVLVKAVPGHTGHGLQERSDSVSKMHRHFPGQTISVIVSESTSVASRLHYCFVGVRAKAVRLLAGVVAD